MFVQAAQWRFAGDLIRRTYRRWNQPAKIAVAKSNSSPGPTRHALSLLTNKTTSDMAALPPIMLDGSTQKRKKGENH
jgi:hypothetical protein